jgi:hypothetical protein
MGSTVAHQVSLSLKGFDSLIPASAGGMELREDE